MLTLPEAFSKQLEEFGWRKVQRETSYNIGSTKCHAVYVKGTEIQICEDGLIVRWMGYHALFLDYLDPSIVEFIEKLDNDINEILAKADDITRSV